MFLVGLTGGIASGKSTVAGMLEKRGCIVIDADKAARQVVLPGTRAHAAIRRAFGDSVFNPDGTLNRQLLGRIIFADGAKRRTLNSIVHPEVRRQMMWQVIACLFKGHHFVILDVPLLIENKNLLPFCSEVVIVCCRPETQRTRLLTRSSGDREALSMAEAADRIGSQMPLERKKKFATNPLCLIDNEGSLEETEMQVAALVAYLQRSPRYLVYRAAAVAIALSFVALSAAGARLVVAWL